VSVTAHARARVGATRPSPLGRRYREQGLWQGRLIDQCIVDAAAAEPDRDALIERERRLTFGSFADSVARGAGMLADLGVERGDVVSWQLPNRIEAAIVHHAVARLGAISNPIVPIYRGREVHFILRQAQSRILVVPRTFRRFDYGRMAVDLRGSLPDLEHVLVIGEPLPGTSSFEPALAAARPVPAAERDPGDVVLLLYTSGTEADPKGVLHSHDTLLYECQSIIDLYEVTPADRMFMPSPVTHITGILYGLQLPFILGTSVVLQEVWDVSAAVDLIERERCTVTVGATPFLHGLVHAPEAARRGLSSLRVFGCGGADVPPLLVRAAYEQLGVRASRLYGSTECPTVTGTPIRDVGSHHSESDGRPIGSTEARVVDAEDVELPRGARGALQVRGPDLCLGYHDAAWNDRSFTEDGWFRTGDLAVLDEDGWLRIAGREKDIIIRGGENLSAKEIEDLLFEHPGVEEAAVVGYPDEILGERICAFVVAATDVSLEQLVAFLRERQIANQKLPEQLRIVTELPKTASGKVQKFRLREQLHAEASAGAGP
jgi:cyclohexanecarboxylate-CoA ligase